MKALTEISPFYKTSTKKSCTEISSITKDFFEMYELFLNCSLGLKELFFLGYKLEGLNIKRSPSYGQEGFNLYP
jgi:hypothetical protein